MKAATKLFLDDERAPYDQTWAVVRDYDAFVRYVEEHGVPDVISFDHDLADEHYRALNAADYAVHSPAFKEKTGCECARWLIARNEFPQVAIIHTFNPIGAQHLARLLAPHCTVNIAPYRRQP